MGTASLANSSSSSVADMVPKRDSSLVYMSLGVIVMSCSPVPTEIVTSWSKQLMSLFLNSFITLCSLLYSAIAFW